MSKREKHFFMFAIPLVVIFVIANIINVIRVSLIRFEYYKDDSFGISKECYQNDKQQCMCKIDDRFISVDSYYEVK